MSKYILFRNGVLSARYDSMLNTLIPSDAIKVDDALFFRTMNESDGVWSFINSNITKVPLPVLSAAEVMDRNNETLKYALQAAIDTKAQALGFSNGNSLMLYAGFVNPFQAMAQTFATWEANIWAEAAAYRDEVIAGTKPALTAAEALLKIPAY